MVLWWAAFFIAGLLAPPSFRVIAAAGIGAAALCAAAGSERFLGQPRSVACGSISLAPAASFIVIAATGLALCEGAGLLRREGANDREKNRIAAAEERRESAGERREREKGPRDSESGPFVNLAPSEIRRRLLDSLGRGRLTKRSEGMVAALVLDGRDRFDPRLAEIYAYLGIAHFIALSGMHLGIIAVPLRRLLAPLPRAGARDWVLAAALFLYGAVAGFPPSLLRALAVAAAAFAARRSGLRTDLLRSLAAGSLALAALDPGIVLDAGFQLSFTAVSAIVLVAIPLTGIIEPALPAGIARRAGEMLVYPALITCAVQFFSLPLVLGLFGRCSGIAPLANVVVAVPFTVLLYLGLVYVFVPIEPLRGALSYPVNALCDLLARAPAAMARWPHPAVYRSDLDGACYAAGVVLACAALRARESRRWGMLAAAAACIACSSGTVRIDPPASAAGEGRCEGKVIVSVRGGAFLAEGGGILFIDERFREGEARRMVRILWRGGVKSIRCAVVTPASLPRGSGIFHLMRRIEVREIVCTPYLLLSERGFEGWCRRRGVVLSPAHRGMAVAADDIRISVSAPVYPPPDGRALSAEGARLAATILAPARGGAIDIDRILPPPR